MEVSVDGTAYTIREFKGIGKTGAVLLDVTMQYTQVNGFTQVQQMQTHMLLHKVTLETKEYTRILSVEGGKS